MAVMEIKGFAFHKAREVVAGLFRADDLERLTPKPKPDVAQTVAPATEQDRYQRLLEREMDRQVMTDVEQHDADLLNRVRAALYED